jgi:hypothetical protein
MEKEKQQAQKKQTFVISTSGSDDTITFKAEELEVVLNRLAGSGIISGSPKTLGGGEF